MKHKDDQEAHTTRCVDNFRYVKLKKNILFIIKNKLLIMLNILITFIGNLKFAK